MVVRLTFDIESIGNQKTMLLGIQQTYMTLLDQLEEFKEYNLKIHNEDLEAQKSNIKIQNAVD